MAYNARKELPDAQQQIEDADSPHRSGRDAEQVGHS